MLALIVKIAIKPIVKPCKLKIVKKNYTLDLKKPVVSVNIHAVIWCKPTTCPGGEIGRHKRLKISRLMGVPVRLRLRAPKKSMTYVK
jgi:hypothetical protein